MTKDPRQHNGEHLGFIRSLACVICGDNTSTEAAHIRFGDLRAAKRHTGMQEKPHDRWAVPLCGKHHRAQHNMNERAFWLGYKIDPLYVAMALALNSGDYEAGSQIVESVKAA